MTPVDEAVAAIRAGGVAVIPTDTVYGLVCAADREDAVRELSKLKGRPPNRPIALVAASVEGLLELVPELRGELLRRVLPGPYTLVLPNPERRFPWLTGDRTETIGLRVPVLEGPGREVLERVGVVAATSANHHGEPDPRRLDDVPHELLSRVAFALDAGELPGTPSTVVELTGEPRVLREGAVPADEALAAVAAALAE